MTSELLSADPVSLATTWLLTYALHSTLLLLAAWLASALLGSQRLTTQESVWRAAVLGGLVTATLQVGFGVSPLARLSIDASSWAQPAGRSTNLVDDTLLAAAQPADRTSAEPRASAPGPARHQPTPWLAALIGLWLLGAVLSLASLLCSACRLLHLLRDRQPVPKGALTRLVRRLAARLGLRRPVALTSSPRIAVPFAVGLRRAEICLPERVAAQLSPAQQEVLLAHELAHVARRDPAWLLLYRLIEGVFFCQPLNRLARRRLQRLAECLADDHAVRCTRNRVDLARCLVEVAGWASATPSPGVVAGAVTTHADLGRRVQRLLSPRRDERHGSPAWLLAPMLASGLLLLGAILPGVSYATESPTPDAQASEADEAEASLRDPGSAERIEALDREIERMAADVAEGVAEQAAELHALEAQVAAVAESLQPTQEQLRLMEEEAARVADEIADVASERATTRAERERARAQMRRLRAELSELVERARPSEEQLRELRARARELAHAYRPSREQLRELSRRARELARELEPRREELEQLAREAREEATLRARELRERFHEERAGAREARERAREGRDRAREMRRRADDELRDREHAERAAEREAQRAREEQQRRERPPK